MARVINNITLQTSLILIFVKICFGVGLECANAIYY